MTKKEKSEYMKDYYKLNRDRLKKTNKEYQDSNKERISKKTQSTYRTKTGLIKNIYLNQVQNSRRRGHQAPAYSKKELIEWCLSQPTFDKLFSKWVTSGFKKLKAPSVDRIDNFTGYSFGNIQIMSWEENRLKGHADMRAGKVIHGTHPQTPVIATDSDGNKKRFVSQRDASRRTGIDQSSIGHCCRGKVKHAGCYSWKYA